MVAPWIRPYEAADVDVVETVYAACHPTWPAKPVDYWWAHPTLVLEGDGVDIIGFTACTVGLAPVAELIRLRQDVEVGWGHGVYVLPAERGKGYGWALAQARHAVLKALGVRLFFGMTQPTNAPMIAIFTRQGLIPKATIPNTYPDGQAGVLYTGEIT